jgi:Ca-activated chloride channel homolog
MTDGIHNTGTHPIDAAYYAASQGITIFTVTFANEADVWLMQQVAQVAGGKHYHANSPSDLVTAFREIAKGLPTVLTK